MTVRTIRLLAITAAAAGTLAVAVYATSLLTSESVYCNRGSFAYWLTISGTIKDVPELSPTSPPRFYSSAGDGPKLPENAVSYASGAAPEAMLREMDRYLVAIGYRKRADGIYEQDESTVTVEVSPEGRGSRVNVRENY
jgi:hypothetical protein